MTNISNERARHEGGMPVVSALGLLRQNRSKGTRRVKVTAFLKIRNHSKRLTEIR
jgi:hypothetical protein